MIHIQIILYNSSDFIPRLVHGFNNSQSSKSVTVHFLENSDERNAEIIKNNKPDFEYTYTIAPKNLGFAKGHNFLFDKFGKKYDEIFIILNPDIIPFYDFLTKLDTFLKELPSSWGAVDLTQFPDEHPKEYNDNFETEWVSGAASVLRAETFKKIGGYDDAMFMYNEDVDLSWRLKEEGYTLYHCPTSKILHIVGSSSRSRKEQIHQSSSSFQLTHSLAGNLYLRYKYFPNSTVEEYTKVIKYSKDFPAAQKLFEEMKKTLSKSQLKKFRSYRSSKLYPDSNYAKHRW